MKLLIVLSIMLWSPLSEVFAKDSSAQLVETGIMKTYIPRGFDDNDRTQIVIEGVFSDTCYRVGPYKTVVNEEQKTITVSQKAYYYQGPCLDIMTPYSQTINLGILNSGNYKILNNLNNELIGALPIHQAKNKGPDDFLYVPLADASITRDEQGKVAVRVDCNFTNRCMRLKEVRVFEDGDNVITVLPIAEPAADVRCRETPAYNYSRTVAVPALDKKTGRFMLNARSLNGQSVTKLFDL